MYSDIQGILKISKENASLLCHSTSMNGGFSISPTVPNIKVITEKSSIPSKRQRKIASIKRFVFERTNMFTGNPLESVIKSTLLRDLVDINPPLKFEKVEWIKVKDPNHRTISVPFSGQPARLFSSILPYKSNSFLRDVIANAANRNRMTESVLMAKYGYVTDTMVSAIKVFGPKMVREIALDRLKPEMEFTTKVSELPVALIINQFWNERLVRWINKSRITRRLVENTLQFGLEHGEMWYDIAFPTLRYTI
jgi:hypothetical protein